MAALSKLEAVNRMLRASGEQPVNSLLTISGDALMAEQILDEVELEYQLTGQVFNTEEVYLFPDNNGEIAISESIISIDTIGNHVTIEVTPRGNKLYWLRQYGRPKNTFDFSELSLSSGLLVRMVLKVEFEDMPTTQQFAVVDEASRRYQMITMADTTTDGMLRQRAAQSRAIARASDIRQRDASIFNFQSGLSAHIAKSIKRGWRSFRG
jgi:hypothetical protein